MVEVAFENWLRQAVSAGIVNHAAFVARWTVPTQLAVSPGFSGIVVVAAVTSKTADAEVTRHPLGGGPRAAMALVTFARLKTMWDDDSSIVPHASW